MITHSMLSCRNRKTFYPDTSLKIRFRINPKYSDRSAGANSVDPDRTTSEWSASPLFAIRPKLWDTALELDCEMTIFGLGENQSAHLVWFRTGDPPWCSLRSHTRFADWGRSCRVRISMVNAGTSFRGANIQKQTLLSTDRRCRGTFVGSRCPTGFFCKNGHMVRSCLPVLYLRFPGQNTSLPLILHHSVFCLAVL